MAFTARTAGTAVYTSQNGSTLSPVPNASTAVGDRMVLIIATKPDTASIPTPTDWELAGSVSGGIGTTGQDTGPMRLTVFTKIATSSGTGDAPGTITITGNNVSGAVILSYGHGAGNTSEWVFTGAADTTTGSPHSVAMPLNPGITAGDYLVAAGAIPTDVTTPSQFSAETVSATGITTVSLTEIGEFDSTNNNDMGGWYAHGPVVTGTASGVPTVSATAGGTTTNVAGPIGLLRLRELPLQASKSGSDSGNLTVTESSSLAKLDTKTASDSGSFTVAEGSSITTFVPQYPTLVYDSLWTSVTGGTEISSGNMSGYDPAAGDAFFVVYFPASDALFPDISVFTSGTSRRDTWKATDGDAMIARGEASGSGEWTVSTADLNGFSPGAYRVLVFRGADYSTAAFHGTLTKETTGGAVSLPLTGVSPTSYLFGAINLRNALLSSVVVTKGQDTPINANTAKFDTLLVGGTLWENSVTSPTLTTQDSLNLQLRDSHNLIGFSISKKVVATDPASYVSSSRSGSADTLSSTNSCPVPAGAAAGMTVIMGVEIFADASSPVTTLTWPDGFEPILEQQSIVGGEGVTLHLAKKKLVVSDTGNYVSTLGATRWNQSMAVLLDNVNTVSVPDANSAKIGSGTAIADLTVDTSYPPVLIQFVANQNGSTHTPPTFFTERQEGDYITVATYEPGSAGEYTSTAATQSSSGRWSAVLFAAEGGGSASSSTPVSGSDSGSISATSEISSLAASSTRTDSGNFTVTETASVFKQSAVSDSGNLTVTEASTSSVSSSRSDTGNLTATETAAVSVTLSTSDSGTLSATDTSSLFVNAAKSGSDSGAFTVVESASVFKSIAVSDSGNFTSTETSTNVVSSNRSDSGNITGTELSQLAVSSSVADSGNLTSTETSNLQVTLDRADSGSFSATETSTSAIQSTRTDSGSLSAAETASLTRISAANDSGNLTVVESASVEVFGVIEKTGSDSGSISATESAVVISSIVASDSGNLTATETSSVYKQIAAADSGNLTATESATLFKAIAVSDSGSLTSTESAVVFNDRPGADSGTFSAVETSSVVITGLVTKSASDSGSFSALESRTVNVFVSVSDSGALSATESTTSQSTLNRTDTGSITATEESLIFVGKTVNDSGEFTSVESSSLDMFEGVPVFVWDGAQMVQTQGVRIWTGTAFVQPPIKKWDGTEYVS